ncbi:nitroreductase family protein (plasmid) [Entomospira entomophila]|uniref:Nitroreductase n=1 Tax=Entomospira entomophila TaxID=2719988 RepID=A0A968GBE1_9SPIO|nr:nitroreductase family protein [Entomospira entomophilus]NIZ41275.1 nitroreductase [Entomospira entomophilus]WDI36197.1 nitroreductase family protein [Entomospira entomophilus]
MTTFMNLAKSRSSIRKYQETPVEREKLITILEAGRIAPTAANKQPTTFMILQNEDLHHLDNVCQSHGAPLAIIICADKNIAWTRPFDQHQMIDIDATIATDHMMLAAEDLGLSSCWITYFDPQQLISNFNIPAHMVPVNILVIGYATEKHSSDRHEQTRKSLSQYITYPQDFIR